MGFTNGFLGGLTLTYSVLYLALHLHRANRSYQRTLLAQPHELLTSHYDPQPPSALDPPVYELQKPGLSELLKDTWNAEVERLVRNVQETDWNAKRRNLEAVASNAWAKLRASDGAAGAGAGIGSGGDKQQQQQQPKLSNPVVDGVNGAVDAIKDGVKDNTPQKRLLEL
ncbi:hypothetical protein DV738_g980, partial [Chaetothyriales sp. CBS 135597]